MYSQKEKLMHFRELSAQCHAKADLELLLKVDKENSNIIRYTIAPERNFENILFDLLNHCTRDEIRTNRREHEMSNNTDEKNKKDNDKKGKTNNKKKNKKNEGSDVPDAKEHGVEKPSEKNEKKS